MIPQPGGEEKRITLKIWDTPGGPEFKHIREIDYKAADVALLVYSIDSASSFETVQEYMRDIEAYS